MKKHHHKGSIPRAEAALVHATIATKAYEIWEHDGCPEHRAEANWLEAERDLLAVQKWNQSGPALPVSF